jgi:hypothetical protein
VQSLQRNAAIAVRALRAKNRAGSRRVSSSSPSGVLRVPMPAGVASRDSPTTRTARTSRRRSGGEHQGQVNWRLLEGLCPVAPLSRRSRQGSADAWSHAVPWGTACCHASAPRSYTVAWSHAVPWGTACCHASAHRYIEPLNCRHASSQVILGAGRYLVRYT